MEKLIPAFEATLFDPILSGACIDMAELGIDSLLDEGIFRGILIVSVLIGIGKTAQNLHDRNLLKQTVKFINTFNERSISQKKLGKYRRQLKENPQFVEDELGRILILLNSNVDLKKSEILAKFYRAYISEDIIWKKFCELSEVISRVFVSDIWLLYAVFNKQISDTSQCAVYQAERLIALGLLDSATKSMSIGSINGSRTERYIQVSEGN